jgi:ribosomal-protein-alanine N-acetyltransferase
MQIISVDLSVKSLETQRLVLRPFLLSDAPFIIKLVSQKTFVENIRDFQVTTIEEAQSYLTNGPLKSYAEFGFGLLHVATRTGVPVGMCGLIKRPTLADVDIGFGFLSEHTGQGYATEAARAVLKMGFEDFKLPRIVAITSPQNDLSINVLTKLNFKFEGLTKATPDGADLKLFSLQGRFYSF